MYCKFYWHVWQETCNELTETQNSRVWHKFAVGGWWCLRNMWQGLQFPLATMLSKISVTWMLDKNSPWQSVTECCSKKINETVYSNLIFGSHGQKKKKKCAQSRFGMLCNANNCLTLQGFYDWCWSLKNDTFCKISFLFLL